MRLSLLLMALVSLSAFSQRGGPRNDLPARLADPDHPGLDRPDLREQWELFWRGGRLRPSDLDRKASLAAQERARAEHPIPAAPGALIANTATWMNLGPFSNRVTQDYPDVDSGRVTGILTHPSDPRILYLATSGGGLFKCTNADLASERDWIWRPMTDSLPWASSAGTLAVGAVAMSPVDPEVIYLGMGDAHDAEARGFFRSSDGGSTWTASSGLGAMTRTLCILPLDADVVLVGGNDGLKRSVDGGRTFVSVDLGGTAAGKVWSLIRFSATDLACSLEADGLPSAGSLWHSHDGGATWAKGLLSGLSPIRITLAASAASASLGWGLAQVLDSVAIGVLKTTDQGRTWIFQAAPQQSGGLFQGIGADVYGYDGSQGSYNQGIAVDPGDPSRIFVGTTACLYRTEDGGQNWTQLTHWYANRHVYAHADFHVAAWSKAGPKTLFLGNDGGLCIVRDPLISSAAIPTSAAGSGPTVPSVVTFLDNRRNRGLSSHLVYRLGGTLAPVPAQARHLITLGLQDNGTRLRQDEGAGLFVSGTFEDRIGGDGFGTVIHPLNGNLMLGSVYRSQIFKSTDGGATPFKPSSNGLDDAGAAPFVTDLILGSADPTGNTVYNHSFDKIWRSTDFADHWQALAMDGFDRSRNIRSMAASATEPSTLAIAASGSADFQVGSGTGYVTTGGVWRPFGPLPNNDRYLSYVWFDTHDARILYVASVSPDLSRSHAWKSVDGGASFTPLDLANGFPFGIPVHVIQNDPTNSSVVFAGTDFGVYRSLDGGASWSRFGLALPFVAVRDLYVAPDGTFVRAATFGRGVWEIGLRSGAVEVGVGPAQATLPSGGSRIFTAAVLGASDQSVTWDTTGGSLSPQGSRMVRYTAPEAAGSYTLRGTSTADPARSASAAVLVKSRDLNGDGSVDVLDLALAAAAYSGSGTPATDTRPDFDGDGDVDDEDLAALLLGY
ncbi:MAG: hypothetical protein KGN80_03270 [Acidobacteriota bacterium]|nr:hypothetical protein [Acidobacteriota bacterium]